MIVQSMCSTPCKKKCQLKHVRKQCGHVRRTAITTPKTTPHLMDLSKASVSTSSGGTCRIKRWRIASLEKGELLWHDALDFTFTSRTWVELYSTYTSNARDPFELVQCISCCIAPRPRAPFVKLFGMAIPSTSIQQQLATILNHCKIRSTAGKIVQKIWITACKRKGNPRVRNNK